MTDSTPCIPSSWAVTPIEDLLTPLEDGRVLHHGWSPQCHKEPVEAGDEWGVLKTTAIQAGEFVDVHNKRLPSKLEPKPHLEVRAGDLLLTCAGPRARCGVPCLVRDTRSRLMLSGKMYRFRVPEWLVDPRYVEAYLLSSAAQAAIDRMKTGISDSGLNLTHGRFKQLPVVLAPRTEQQRIVEAIESYFTRLDDAVATLERVQRNLKRYRASVLKAAVEGRLVPTEAELARAEGRYYEPASVLLERVLSERRRRWEEAELAKMQARGKEPISDRWKAKYKEPPGPDSERLPELPEGWVWATTFQVAEVIAGYGFPKSLQGRVTGQVPFFKVGDISRAWQAGRQYLTRAAHYVSDRDLVQLKAKPLPAGTTVFAKIGAAIALNRRAMLSSPALVDNNVFGLSPRPEVDPEYVFYLMCTMGFGDDSRATTVPSLRKSDVGLRLIPLPPRAEQRRIAEALSEATSAELRLSNCVEINRGRTARLRQAILKWAFEGNLVDQDPADEPATSLLDRIRAERKRTVATVQKKKRSARKRRQTRA